MAIEEGQGQRLQAKARQLKERALGTADITRRKQFLLIASEYEKLAQHENGCVVLEAFDREIAPNNRAPHLGVVTWLRFATQPTPDTIRDVAAVPRGRSLRKFRRQELTDVVIWAILALIAFAI